MDRLEIKAAFVIKTSLSQHEANPVYPWILSYTSSTHTYTNGYFHTYTNGYFTHLYKNMFNYHSMPNKNKLANFPLIGSEITPFSISTIDEITKSHYKLLHCIHYADS